MMKRKVYPISQRIRKDLKKVEKELAKLVSLENSMLADTSLTTLQAGGKRLRPTLVLVAGSIGKYDLGKLMPVAMAAELIHMASLVHDDILDNASTRRGLPTVNCAWGKQIAVATGDFLFASAFELLCKVNSPQVMKAMADASLALSVGELKQTKTAYSTSQTVDNYLEKVGNKTAALFAASCASGAVVSQAAEGEVEALKEYGENLGMAFQIYDDVLDFQGESQVLGKEVGGDLREGNLTMPVFFALEDEKVSRKLRSIIGELKNTKAKAAQAVELVKQTDGVEKAKKEAKRYVKQALKTVDRVFNKEARENLATIGNFVIDRYH